MNGASMPRSLDRQGRAALVGGLLRRLASTSRPESPARGRRQLLGPGRGAVVAQPDRPGPERPARGRLDGAERAPPASPPGEAKVGGAGAFRRSPAVVRRHASGPCRRRGRPLADLLGREGWSLPSLECRILGARTALQAGDRPGALALMSAAESRASSWPVAHRGGARRRGARPSRGGEPTGRAGRAQRRPDLADDHRVTLGATGFVSAPDHGLGACAPWLGHRLRRGGRRGVAVVREVARRRSGALA